MNTNICTQCGTRTIKEVCECGAKTIRCNQFRGIWEHYKGGLYLVFGIAKHTERQCTFVSYAPLNSPDNLSVRPINMWQELIHYNGREVKRFIPRLDLTMCEKRSDLCIGGRCDCSRVNKLEAA